MDTLRNNLPYLLLLAMMLGWGLRRFKLGLLLLVLSCGALGYFIYSYPGMLIFAGFGLASALYKKHHRKKGRSGSHGGGGSSGAGAGRSF